MDENPKAYEAPISYQIAPAILLARSEQMLVMPVRNPMAVAVSSFGTIFEIQAFEIPSVAAAYKP